MQAQLAAAPLMQRLELASVKVLRACNTLAPRAGDGSGAGNARRGALGYACLPHAVALHILSFLPADARARAALVCRAWRATISDPQLWTVLDLSPASGVARPVSDATLLGAAALARGGIKALCLDGCFALTRAAQLDVATANAGSLRELSCVSVSTRGAHIIEELARAAPQLESFKVDAEVTVTEATRMLRNEVPFGALQLHSLHAGPNNDDEVDEEEEWLGFSSALSAHTSPRQLRLAVDRAPLDLPAVMEALTAAALACNLRFLDLYECDLSQASVPALARLIMGGSLETLHIFNNQVQLLDEAAAVQLADAVTASRTLTQVELFAVCLWEDAAAAAVMMRALTGHSHLQAIKLGANDPPDPSAAGVALGALVAANTPALTTLDVGTQELGDVGLGPLFDALPRNNHLRELRCAHTGMSAAFARDVVLPAARLCAPTRRCAS